MAHIEVLLKNGKSLRAEGSVAQVVLWRKQLSEGETLQLPTWNGRMRVDGRAVRGMSCETGALGCEEAAAAMMAEPYTHYRCEGKTYQYSEMSRQFEMAERRMGVVLWDVAPLRQGAYERIGRDSVI